MNFSNLGFLGQKLKCLDQLTDTSTQHNIYNASRDFKTSELGIVNFATFQLPVIHQNLFDIIKVQHVNVLNI